MTIKTYVKRSLVFALGLMLFASAAFATSPNRLVIAQSSEITSLDPRLATDIYSFRVIKMMMEELVAFAPDLSLEPRLATDWEFSDDGLTLTFNLREGVMFHHGREFTSDDVRYTFEWVLDPENDAPNRQLYIDIALIDTPDDYTVVFNLSEPNSFLLNNIARMPIVPADLGDEDFASNPVGTGPMVFEFIRRDDQTVLNAFEDYWGGRAQVDSVEIRPIPETATRLLAFEGGEIDMFQDLVVPAELSRLEEDPNIIVHRSPGTGYTYMGFNQRSEPLDDVRVRQAINHMIPREAIVERILEGIGEPGVSMIMPYMTWFNEDVTRYDYNPERAQELLEEAGHGDGFSVRMHVSDDTTRVQIAEIMGFELSQVGINLSVTVEEFGAFLSRVQDTDDYDLFILGWGGQLDPDRAMIRQFTSDGGSNYTYYSNPRVDELVNQGRLVPPDSDESIEIYQEAQEIIVEESPYAFIFYTEEIALHHPYIEGWEIHPYSANTYQDIHLIQKNQ
jgi:peptide/nickel transport system substrate-binding protein